MASYFFTEVFAMSRRSWRTSSTSPSASEIIDLTAFFIEAVHLHTTISKPPFDLSRGVGVIQPSQFVGSGGDGFLVLGIAEDCVCHQFTVDQNATVVDLLVHLVEPHLTFGNRVVPQLVADLTLRIHISDTIGFEPLPLFRLVRREVSGSAAVGL